MISIELNGILPGIAIYDINGTDCEQKLSPSSQFCSKKISLIMNENQQVIHEIVAHESLNVKRLSPVA